MKIKLAAFDIDGTLLNDNREISVLDKQSLISLGNIGVTRVAATGRNYYSVTKLLPADFPLDFVVFSSGAGVMNWRTKEILVKYEIDKNDIEATVQTFLDLKLSFTVNMPVPETHFMRLYLQDKNAIDLRNYTNFYKDFLTKLDIESLPHKATQLIALINNNKELHKTIEDKLSNLKVILTTSPINKKSLWVEVFNKNVSKAKGIGYLCKELNIDRTETFGIGNDYNDVDLLNFTNYSYVVDNCQEELKKYYKITQSNNNNGFTFALRQHIEI